MTLFSTGEVLSSLLSWLWILQSTQTSWIQIGCKTGLQQDKCEIKKGGKLLLSKESAISESEAAQATTLMQWTAKSEKGKLLPSVKINNPNFNEADT